MASKATNLNAEKDADLLKAFMNASGGVTGKGAAFWKEVASAMIEEITGEAARKRFDKYKPGAPAAKGKINPEKDADLLMAVIKVNGGVHAKGKAFWETVATYMEETITGEAVRKRFDKFKAKGIDSNAVATSASVVAKKESKKGIHAKTKATKKNVKDKNAVKYVVKNEVAKYDEVENKQKTFFETPADSKHSNQNGLKSGDRTQDAEAFQAYVKEGKGTLTKKRAFVEDWVESASSSGGGEFQFEVETPAKPFPSQGRPLKKMKTEAIDED